eukprot:scaffold5330_cov125-Isochrysis_galbana.AAC.7
MPTSYILVSPKLAVGTPHAPERGVGRPPRNGPPPSEHEVSARRGTHPLPPSLHGLSSAQGPSSPPCLRAATIAGSKGERSGGG